MWSEGDFLEEARGCADDVEAGGEAERLAGDEGAAHDSRETIDMSNGAVAEKCYGAVGRDADKLRFCGCDGVDARFRGDGYG